MSWDLLSSAPPVLPRQHLHGGANNPEKRSFPFSGLVLPPPPPFLAYGSKIDLFKSPREHHHAGEISFPLSFAATASGLSFLLSSPCSSSALLSVDRWRLDDGPTEEYSCLVKSNRPEERRPFGVQFQFTHSFVM